MGTLSLCGFETACSRLVYPKSPVIAEGLCSIFGHFLGESFKIYMDAIQADHLNGPITFIMMTCILAGITIMYTHKIFDLVPWIPENVMKWVGHAMHDLGEKGDVQHTRQAAAAVVSSGQGAGSSAMTAGMRDGVNRASGEESGANNGHNSINDAPGGGGGSQQTGMGNSSEL